MWYCLCVLSSYVVQNFKLRHYQISIALQHNKYQSEERIIAQFFYCIRRYYPFGFLKIA